MGRIPLRAKAAEFQTYQVFSMTKEGYSTFLVCR